MRRLGSGAWGQEPGFRVPLYGVALADNRFFTRNAGKTSLPWPLTEPRRDGGEPFL